MARPPKRPSRGGAGDRQRLVRGRGGSSSLRGGPGLATQGPYVERPVPVDGDDQERCSDDDLEIEDDDDILEDAAALGLDLEQGDASEPITIDDNDGDDVNATSGKAKSVVWDYFYEVKENGVRVSAVCKHCNKKIHCYIC